jgi:hypothetical protein
MDWIGDVLSVAGVRDVLVTTLVGVLVMGAVRLFQWAGLELTSKHRAALTAIVRAAILRAEEVIEQRGSRSLPASEKKSIRKLTMATGEIMTASPTTSPAEAERLVEGELFLLGLGTAAKRARKAR